MLPGVVPGAGLMVKEGLDARCEELLGRLSPPEPTMRDATDGALASCVTVVRSVSGALVSVDT